MGDAPLRICGSKLEPNAVHETRQFTIHSPTFLRQQIHRVERWLPAPAPMSFFKRALLSMGTISFKTFNVTRVLQYSLSNAPDFSSLVDKEKQDWITYFKFASRKNQKDVEKHIQTPAVLKAFEMATLSRLPRRVKFVFDKENDTYNKGSEYTTQRLAQGEAKAEAKAKAEGKAERLLVGACVMKHLKNTPDAEIARMFNLTKDEVAGTKRDKHQ
jgi:hypothetical protein